MISPYRTLCSTLTSGFLSILLVSPSHGSDESNDSRVYFIAIADGQLFSIGDPADYFVEAGVDPDQIDDSTSSKLKKSLSAQSHLYPFDIAPHFKDGEPLDLYFKPRQGLGESIDKALQTGSAFDRLCQKAKRTQSRLHFFLIGSNSNNFNTYLKAKDTIFSKGLDSGWEILNKPHFLAPRVKLAPNEARLKLLFVECVTAGIVIHHSTTEISPTIPHHEIATNQALKQLIERVSADDSLRLVALVRIDAEAIRAEQRLKDHVKTYNSLNGKNLTLGSMPLNSPGKVDLSNFYRWMEKE